IAARQEIAQAIEHQQVFRGVFRQAPALVQGLSDLSLLQQALGIRERVLAIEGHGLLPLATFLNSRLLSGAVPQVVQLRAAHLAEAGHFESRDDRRVKREDPLDADAARSLPHGEGGPQPGSTATADDVTLENLDAGLVALDHTDVNLDAVARAKLRNLRLPARRPDHA